MYTRDHWTHVKSMNWQSVWLMAAILLTIGATCYLNHLWSIHGTLWDYTSTASPDLSAKKNLTITWLSPKNRSTCTQTTNKKNNQLNNWQTNPRHWKVVFRCASLECFDCLDCFDGKLRGEEGSSSPLAGVSSWVMSVGMSVGTPDWHEVGWE